MSFFQHRSSKNNTGLRYVQRLLVALHKKWPTDQDNDPVRTHKISLLSNGNILLALYLTSSSAWLPIELDHTDLKLTVAQLLDKLDKQIQHYESSVMKEDNDGKLRS